MGMVTSSDVSLAAGGGGADEGSVHLVQAVLLIETYPRGTPVRMWSAWQGLEQRCSC